MYRKCGWPVYFFTESAVSNVEGETEFFSDNNPEKRFYGAGIVKQNTNIKDKTAAGDDWIFIVAF